MRLGCHACLFQDKILTQTDEILKGLSATGFEGVEIGLRFFGTEKKEFLYEKLKQYNMELSGIHVAPLLTDFANNMDGVREVLITGAEFVKDNKSKNIIMTGMNRKQGETKTDERLNDPDFLAKVAANMEILAKEVESMGVTINYHNHNWEFENDGIIYYAILKGAPSIKFALDIGWVAAGGFDPLEIIQASPQRFNYVHLRDRDLKGKEFVDLGLGDFDYHETMKTLQDIIGEDGWAIVEYETGDQDFNRYTRANKFLDQIR